MSDDLALTAKQNISEHIDALTDIAESFKLDVLQLVDAFDKDEIHLGGKLKKEEVGRAMYHLGYILGFAVGREQSVEELFQELGLP